MAVRKKPGTLDSFLEPKKPKLDEDDVKMTGKWESIGKDMLIFSSENVEGRAKILGVDLDGTIITTKSGKTFPQNIDDWKLFDAAVPNVLQKFYSDGFKIVIFTNQKGIQTGKIDANSFKRKIENILLVLKVPIQVIISLGSLKYRKPCIGMWEYLEENMNSDISIDRSESLYVGDAAGRVATKTKKKDFSSADRLFATNIGLKFYTPEEFFLKKKDKDQFILPAFNPRTFIETKRDRFEPADTKIPSLEKEIIVLVGLPGCGKTKFASELSAEHGYGVVNRDTMKTWQKCVEATKIYLKKGLSVVVDNTNCDVLSRKRYIDVAKSFNVSCRCFYLVCDIAQAAHNCRYRVLAGTDLLHDDVGVMVLRMMKSKFQEPTVAEGFSSIVKVNFVPKFENDTQRHLYCQYLCDS
uniref:Bifunctional polynucleotide phosphatase/kinase n=1 Tax=Syphacia muris TaxID=451379 RepID=A0A0N5AK68_9BILA